MSGAATKGGEYRQVYTRILDSWEWLDLSTQARMAFMVLKLRLGRSGIDTYNPAGLPMDTGLSAAECDAALEELEQSDWLRRERNIFWIRNGLRFDPNDPLGQPNLRKAILAHLDGLPRCALVEEFARYYELRRPPKGTPNRPPEVSPEAPADAGAMPGERVPEGWRKGGERVPEGFGIRKDVGGSTKDVGGRTEEDGAARSRGAALVPPMPDAPLAVGAADATPFAGLDWEGRTSGAAVLAEWIRLQPAPPCDRDRTKLGAICRRIADSHTTGEIALAFIGMRHLWPHRTDAKSPGDPWTPVHLERRFPEALAAAAKHPQVKARRDAATFEAQLAAGSGLFRRSA